MMKSRKEGKGGFSLVEVCLAVLVVGLGIMSVMALFPTGLAASEAATVDTENGLFAAQVLSGFHARASSITWDDWVSTNVAAFALPGVTTNKPAINTEKTIAYYLNIGTDPSRNSKVMTIKLYMIPWRAETLPPIKDVMEGNMFYTELFYAERPK